MKSVRLFGREISVYKLAGALAIFSVVVAAATYTVTKSITVSVEEPFNITVEPEQITLSPGSTGTVRLKINNLAEVNVVVGQTD